MSFKSSVNKSSIAEFYELVAIIIKEKKILWLLFVAFKFRRPHKHVEKLIKQSGLPKKEIERIMEVATGCVLDDLCETSSGVQKMVSISEINKINRIHAIVNLLYQIRVESKSSHAINLLCTTEINRIRDQLDKFGSVEQCSLSAYQHHLVEVIIEDYQPYAEFDLNNRSSIQMFDLDLEKESIKVLLDHRTDCLIANGSTTLH